MKKESIEMVWNEKVQNSKGDISILNKEQSQKVIQYHKSFAVYEKTPLVNLKNLAQKCNVNAIYLKDESYRFGLNAFISLEAIFSADNVETSCPIFCAI